MKDDMRWQISEFGFQIVHQFAANPKQSAANPNSEINLQSEICNLKSQSRP